MPRADAIRPYSSSGEAVPFIQSLSPASGRVDYESPPTGCIAIFQQKFSPGKQKAYLLFPQNMIQSAKINVEVLPTGIPQQTSSGKPAERQGRKVQVSNPDFSGMID